jgi:hypothetical protein
VVGDHFHEMRGPSIGQTRTWEEGLDTCAAAKGTHEQGTPANPDTRARSALRSAVSSHPATENSPIANVGIASGILALEARDHSCGYVASHQNLVADQEDGARIGQI